MDVVSQRDARAQYSKVFLGLEHGLTLFETFAALGQEET